MFGDGAPTFGGDVSEIVQYYFAVFDCPKQQITLIRNDGHEIRANAIIVFPDAN
jgi:hypothetical protein